LRFLAPTPKAIQDSRTTGAQTTRSHFLLSHFPRVYAKHNTYDEEEAGQPQRRKAWKRFLISNAKRKFQIKIFFFVETKFVVVNPNFPSGEGKTKTKASSKVNGSRLLLLLF